MTSDETELGPRRERCQEAVRNHGAVDLMQKKDRTGDVLA